MKDAVSRRNVLAAASAAIGAAAVGATAAAPASETPAGDFGSGAEFRFSLNTSTIRGQKLGLVEEIEVAAKAGYDGIEPWLDEIRRYQQFGGDLQDIANRCADHGLAIPSAIGFARWIVDDPAERARGLEVARRDMDLVHRIGGTRIAAPPAGATDDGQQIELLAAAERYANLLELGRQIGVTPQVEVWGFSANLSRLGEATFVAIESGHPDACVLPDVYHLYKGGSDSAGLKLLGRQAIHCFHLNDYPADPPRESIRDENRLYPGDGIAPFDQIIGALASNHTRCMLSLELFHPGYWRQDALTVARTGLVKCRAAVANALSS